MSKTAFIFPGQGSQAVGMGLDIFQRFPSAAKVFEEADSALGFSLSRLCFEGPEDDLIKTVNVQPAVLTVSIAHLNAVRQSGLKSPDLVAGHSLGQYSALVAAGVLSLADAVRLVRERGRLMYEAGQAVPGGMLAVIGAEEAVIVELCTASGTEVSNLNAPGQVVVSGSLPDLDKFKTIAAGMGIRRVIPLKVSGAFHSRWMQPAADGLKQAIAACTFSPPEVPVVSNVTAELLNDAESLRKELADQLTACVQWQKSVNNMVHGGVSEFYEIGHGQVLGGLVKRIYPGARITYAADLLRATG